MVHKCFQKNESMIQIIRLHHHFEIRLDHNAGFEELVITFKKEPNYYDHYRIKETNLLKKSVQLKICFAN